MTWKELVNFVKHHETDVEGSSAVEFEDSRFTHEPVRHKVQSIYFANESPCVKCDHKHDVVRLRSELVN